MEIIKFEPQELEVMKKSGEAIGRVAKHYISEIYQLDRARTVEDIEKQIKNISLRAISIEKKEEKDDTKIYMPPIADLMELINKYKETYDEIKDIVLVYAGVELSYLKWKESQSKK